MEEKLLGHLMKANDPETDREVERLLADDPAVAHDLSQLRLALAPLEAAREEIEPPADLWVRTLARVAEHIVATEGATSIADASRTEALIRRAAAMSVDPPAAAMVRPAPPVSDPPAAPPGRRNVVAIVGLSAAVLALAFPAVMHVRERNQRVRCQDSMQNFYQAAAGYSDDNNQRFPQVADGMPATTVADALKRSGYLPQDVRFVCPATHTDSPSPSTLVNYAYSLGFRDESGQLCGMARSPDTTYLPMLADAPIRQGNLVLPGNHRHGHNVLFAGGHVRFCTSANVGVNNDDIFCNRDGLARAGLSPMDTVLGRPEESP